MLASNTYDTETIAREGRIALELLGAEDSFVRLSVMRTLGVAQHVRGDRHGASETYREIIRESQRSGNRFLEILTTTGLGMLEESELRLTSARTLHERVIELAGEPTQPVACASWLGLARVAYQRNDLEDARTWAVRGIELAEAIEGVDVPVEGAVLLARIRHAQGARTEADSILADARAQARANGYASQLVAIAQLRSRWLATHGRVSDARRTLAEADPDALEMARLELAAGDRDAAAARLEQWTAPGGTDERTVHAVLRAMISAGTGDTDGAIAGIAEPMSALRAEDNVRFLADEGSAIVPVLEECVRSGVEPEFATRVLALIDAAAPEAAVAARREETGLSRRELEVLRLLATGLSNQEIADRLFVSLSTVKGHTTHIYEKLGANRRTDAVARAQERGLLDARPRQPEG
jgi:LuxR family maltose regulon positive regulatory protein